VEKNVGASMTHLLLLNAVQIVLTKSIIHIKVLYARASPATKNNADLGLHYVTMTIQTVAN
jgi:hypothetical protein